jgi:hypothetical protein
MHYDPCFKFSDRIPPDWRSSIGEYLMRLINHFGRGQVARDKIGKLEMAHENDALSQIIPELPPYIPEENPI